MKIMKVAKSTFFTKSNTIDTVVRNTSCSRGWLRVVVQSIFGTLTVASFVLIVLLAVSRPMSSSTKCIASNCRLKCHTGDFNDLYELDVVTSVSETGLHCDKVMLTFTDLHFPNGTMPINWMSRLPAIIEKLFIVGGDLRHIPPTAFLGQFGGGLEELSFEDITLTSWTADTFVGLSHLQVLMFKNSMLLNIERNALRAVDNTIVVVNIANCRKWNPQFVTGTKDLEKVQNVYLSQNDFGSTLNARSFLGLRSCRVLFLNSCKITSIGIGAFDPLENIEMLFLNDNHLAAIQDNLFRTIIQIHHPKPRIHLQDNLWKCDCSQKELMQLSRKDLLLVDPVCYRPEAMNGRTISKLEEYCKEDEEDVEVIIANGLRDKVLPSDMFTRQCFFGERLLRNMSLQIVSPAAQFRCHFNEVEHFENIPHKSSAGSYMSDITDNDWLKPTFLMSNDVFASMQVGSTAKDDYGLIWHQSTCPNEAYCVNVMPNFLRVYNVLLHTVYTFCPFNLETFQVELSDCVRYNTSLLTHSEIEVQRSSRVSYFLYLLTGLICLFFGAMVVYAVVRVNPYLLKGSKRLLFVKHRGVDALVLPPKIPLRSSLSGEETFGSDDPRIFTILDNTKLLDENFVRMNSVRSDKSTTPTYISAMQPTDAQLAEWRIRNHFDKNDSIISISSEMSRYSRIREHCNEDSNILYESLK